MKRFALITGASGGMGRKAAHRLAEDGWNLYLHYNNNKEACLQLMKELKPYSIEVIPISADLESDEGVNQLIQGIFQLDAIVYASGTSHYGLFMDTTLKEMDDLIQIHIKSPMRLIQMCLPKLMKSEQSSIVVVSSIWGQTGAACEVLYSTVKGAQISFVKALSKEVAMNGMRINAIAPGAIDTNMMKSFTDEDIEQLKEEIPAGRLGKPEEVADAVSFLLSPRSSYITGQVLSINGGWYT
ncbi:elongation factor P 5-aminopentanone reductase [Falsibacillus pallidus]|uniref:elongation factor P 5-aminopentanone reductase n=1 Tax=Falsibacillus pallidus TaxID=493781 RepID=UPI003D95100A